MALAITTPMQNNEADKTKGRCEITTKAITTTPLYQGRANRKRLKGGRLVVAMNCALFPCGTTGGAGGRSKSTLRMRNTCMHVNMSV